MKGKNGLAGGFLIEPFDAKLKGRRQEAFGSSGALTGSLSAHHIAIIAFMKGVEWK